MPPLEAESEPCDDLPTLKVDAAEIAIIGVVGFETAIEILAEAVLVSDRSADAALRVRRAVGRAGRREGHPRIIGFDVDLPVPANEETNPPAGVERAFDFEAVAAVARAEVRKVILGEGADHDLAEVNIDTGFTTVEHGAADLVDITVATYGRRFIAEAKADPSPNSAGICSGWN